MDNNDIQELIDLAEEAIAYTPLYFRVKWDMENRLETLKGSWTEHASKKPCSRPDAKDHAALIVAGLCFVGLLVCPQHELLFALVGASVLFVSLARQWW